MGRKLTAVLAAGALMFAACGDDGGGDEEGGGDTEEVDSATDEATASDTTGGTDTAEGGEEGESAAGDDVQAFCDALQATDNMEEVQGAEPPAEIADAWDEIMADPEDVDDDSAAAVEFGQWFAENCLNLDEAVEEAGELGEDFMDDFCVEMPDIEGADLEDNPQAC